MQQANQYEIVIIECCESCDSHQSVTKHSEWKYYEHFNELKKKIQRYVAGTIVIKNPVPDELCQPPEMKLQKNIYLNNYTQQQITFPRVGSFQVYIYNILISSKLTSNAWPNHYKILQTLNQIITAKKQGLPLEEFSIYQVQLPIEQTQLEKKQKKLQNNVFTKQSPQTKETQQRRKIVSKKKKGTAGNEPSGPNRFRVYKSKEPKLATLDKSLNKNSAILDPLTRQVTKKLQTIIPHQQAQQNALKNASLRYIQSKNQNRVKLPSLKNTLNMLNAHNRKNAIGDTSMDEKRSKKIFNTMDGNVFDKDQMSIIQKDPEMIRMLESSDGAQLSMNRFDSLVLYNNDDSILVTRQKGQHSPSPQDKYAQRRKQDISNRNQRRDMGSQNDFNQYEQENEELINESDNMRAVQNRSVQYSQMKEYMTRSIQYEQNVQFCEDFGVQIDQNTRPRDIMMQFVQTDHIQIKQPQTQEQLKKKQKPYMLDESVQVQIIIKKKQKTRQVQTFVPQMTETQINTDIKQLVNRGNQFPDEDQKNRFPIELDIAYMHLFEKRRNLPIEENQNIYSIDRFEEKSTKYKWIGKAFEETTFKDLKRKLLLQALVFAVYNFFGIKTPQKRIAFLQCSNVVGQRITNNNSALYHLLSQQNPQIQNFNQFEELDIAQKIFPLSEEITYRNSKKKVKFNNWGKFLALVYFLDDNGVFDNSSGPKLPSENLLANSPTSMNQRMTSPRQFSHFQSKHASNIGLVITNEQAKQIYRMSCQNYQLFSTPSPQIQLNNQHFNKEELIFLTSNRKQLYIDPKRLSKSVELEFISMLSRLTMEKTFTELKHYLNDVFINRSKVYDEKFMKLFESIQKYEHLQIANQIKEGRKNKKDSPSSPKKKRQPLAKTNDAAEMDEMQQLLKAFIDKLQNRFSLISQSYKGKIYCYRKYNSLQAKISYSLSANPVIQRSLQVSYIANSQKPQSEYKVQIQDVIKMLKTNTNVLFLTGEEGFGKSYFLQQVKKTLSTNEKYNALYLQNIQKVENPKKFIDNKFYEKKKNIILIDNLNSEKDTKLLVSLIKAIALEKQDKYDLSYLCVLKEQNMFDPLTLKLNSLINRNISRQQKFINLRMQPLSDENIKHYISKTVDFKNVTQKNQLSEKIIKSISHTPALANSLYLNLYCQIIETERLDEFIVEYDPNKITKWWIIKKTFEKCKLRHMTELKDMDIELPAEKDVYFELRQLVMRLHVMERYPEYYATIRKSQNDKVSKQQAFLKLQQHKVQLIQQLFSHFQQDHDRLVKNHLQFYPVDTKYLVRIKTEKAHLMQDQNEERETNFRLSERNDIQTGGIKLEEFFVQGQFYQFLLVEAFSYYLSKGFKNLELSDIVLDPHLLSMLRQKAQLQPSFCQQLLQLIYDTQTYPALSEQGSNAMTILSHLNYQFSNLIFDHCQLQNTDISLSTFYNCSFRDTNLMNATLYKTSFLNCAIDATVMDNVNLLVKKYEIEFTPLCCAISRDVKQIVLGCGNYLVVLSTQTGKELKKVEAHLDVIRSVKFSKDGQYLITTADDKTLRTWDTQNFKSVVFKLPQKGGAVFFSNQSQTIATVVNKNDLKVWNIKSMANEGLFEGHTDQITSVNFSLNGEYILTGSKDTTVRLWNLKGKQLHTYKGHDKEIICAKISPTNAIIASSSKQKQLILFQTLTQAIVAKKEFPNEIIEICLDLREIYICCAFAQDQKISILSFTSLEIVHKLQGHQQKIISINFDASFEKLISLSKDRTVRLWDLESIIQKQLPLQELYKTQKTPQGPALSIAYSKKLSQYATGHQNGEINIWDDQTNRILHKLTDHHGYVSRLEYDLTGKLYSGGKDGILRIWNFEKFEQKKKQPYRKLQLFSCEMVDMKINDKNKIIVMSSVNNEFVVYDFTGIKLIMSTRDEGKINSIAFDQKDRYMAIGGGQKYVVTFKLENQGNTITRSQELGEHPETISSLAYQGESLLISVLKNGHIYIWNHMRVMLIKKIQNMSPITCLSIYNRIFGCLSSEDGKIRIINLDQGKQVKVFKYKEPCLQFVTKFSSSSNNSNQIPLMYAACKDGNIIKWNLNDLKMISQKSLTLLPIIAQQRKMSKFGRKAVNEDGTIMAQVQGDKTIKLKNLHEHTQELIKLDKCPSQIEGLQFIESFSHEKVTNIQQSLLVLLKSGQFWSLKSNSVYEPSSNPSSSDFMMNPGNSDGDLYYSKIRENIFYKSGIKKVSKQIRKPTQLIVDEMTIGG